MKKLNKSLKIYYNLKYSVQVISNEIINYFNNDLDAFSFREKYFEYTVNTLKLDKKTRKRLKSDYLSQYNVSEYDYFKNKYEYNELFMISILNLDEEILKKKLEIQSNNQDHY